MVSKPSQLRLSNILELATGIITVALASYPYPIWFLTILGLVPIISFGLYTLDINLGKKVKGGVEIVLVAIAASYIYVLSSLSQNNLLANIPSLTTILILATILTVATLILKLLD